MDDKWSHNQKIFFDKIELMDANFCTSDPNSLNIGKKYNILYMPNPVDESFEILKNYENQIS